MSKRIRQRRCSMCRGMMFVVLAALVVLAAVSADAAEVTIAVLTFEAKGKEVKEYGKQAGDLLTAMIPAVNPEIKTVERAKLDEILKELEMSLTGVADETNSLKVGKLAGAQLIVTGRLFVLDETLYAVAKIIGTETSKVKAEFSKGKLSGKLSPILEALAQKVALSITENLPDLLPAKDDKKSPADAIAAAIRGKRLPKVAVVVREEHVSRRTTVDPAVETEITFILKKCGFEIVGGKEKELSKWAKAFLGESGAKVPASISEADVIIVGEAFSEFAARTGNLVTCKARIEIQAIERETGKLLSIQRKNTRVADLSEQIAGKKALQKAAADIAPELIIEAVNAWNKTAKRR